jgi:gliding motility-associated-like protein
MQPTLPLHTPGQYIWIVKDSIGCEERDTFNAIFIGPVSADVTSISPLCPGDTDGQLIIESIEKGSGPFMIQLDNRPPLLFSQFPFVLDQVGTGNHILTITDMIGCELKWPVQVMSQNFGTLDLGPDVRIQKGDSTFIAPNSTGILVQTATWNIQNPGTGLAPFWYGPEETSLVIVEVVDSLGCIYKDSLLITVYEAVDFYIPTIFSPNGDQINDVLEVHTNLPNDQLISLEIFDGWGNMIYRQHGNAPLRWDGYSKNKFVMSGVYVYKIVWEDEKQNQQLVVGDVTVVR